jgi:hypothetical protein
MNEDSCRSWRIARQSEVVLCIVYERREIKGYLFFNAKLFIVIDNMMQKLINHFLSPYYQQLSTNTTTFYKHGLPQHFFFMDIVCCNPCSSYIFYVNTVIFFFESCQYIAPLEFRPIVKPPWELQDVPSFHLCKWKTEFLIGMHQEFQLASYSN